MFMVLPIGFTPFRTSQQPILTGRVRSKSHYLNLICSSIMHFLLTHSVQRSESIDDAIEISGCQISDKMVGGEIFSLGQGGGDKEPM